MKIFRLRRLRKKGMSSSASRKTEEQRRLRNLLNTSMILKAAIGITIVFLVVTCLIIPEHYFNLGVTVGIKADMDYYNSFDFDFPDPQKTQDKRLDAVSEIPDIYRFEEVELVRDLSVVISNIKEWLAKRQELESSDNPPTGEELARLREECEKKIGEALPKLDKEDISVMTALEKPIEGMGKIKSIIESHLDDKIVLSKDSVIPGNVEDAAESLKIELKQFLDIERNIRNTVDEAFKDSEDKEKRKLLKIPSFFITQKYLNQLYIYSDSKTKGLLKEAVEDGVKEQYRTVTRFSVIVKRGRPIQREHMVQLLLNRQKMQNEKTRGEMAIYRLGITAIVVVLLTIFGGYLWVHQHNVFSSNSKLSALGTVIVLTLAFSKAIISLVYIHPFFCFPVFVSFSGILTSLMLGLNPAFVISFVMATLIGIMFDFSLFHAFLALTGSIISAYFARNARRRSDMMKVGLIAGGANALVILSVGIAWSKGIALTHFWQALGGFTFGILGAILATVFLPVFEYIFSITTNISLMELTDTKNPLLRRLMMETPGTYHHSLVVGNLAEAAAESVDANPLLTRVASYYHDVGKLKKPEYFSENERQSKSKHDTLIPSMSSLIIISHVKEGVDLAIKHKLSKDIINVIKQHHGTNLVYYFYKRATDHINGDESIDERDFRYSGPKPQSKEAAIIMLADSVEAASRSLERVSLSKLQSLVHDIITLKFGDGQLDECDLTLKDLHKIEETFIHLLMGSLHQRVKYPKEGEKTSPSGNGMEERQNDRIEEQSKVVGS